MLRDLESEASKYGLKINADKTKVLQLDSRFTGADRVQLAGAWVEEIAEEKSEKYLGRKV